MVRNERRATSDQAKQARRDAILAVAAKAFDRLGFSASSMDWLASQAGLAKGTLYLYYPTKESVFLALYRRELDAWFEHLDEALKDMPYDAPAKLAGCIADSIERQPRLPALASILHSVIENNVGETDVIAFRRHALARMGVSGDLLEARLSFLDAGDGARLLLRVNLLMIGCWQGASPALPARRALERTSELALFRFESTEELENMLVLLLEGWRTCGGGF